MQFISAKPLIDKYRSGTFQESEVAPYFMAYVILVTIVTGFSIDDMNPWSVASGFASIVITIIGVYHLKRQNNDTFGNGFLSKYFSLGWVITCRMILIAIPIAVVMFAFASIVGGNDAIDPAGAIFTISFEVLFYWWLGVLIAQSNQSESEQDAALKVQE
jgi:hypothetical protein